MHKYEITYGNNAWKDAIIVYAKSKKEAIISVEKELRKKVNIINVIQL